MADYAVSTVEMAECRWQTIGWLKPAARNLDSLVIIWNPMFYCTQWQQHKLLNALGDACLNHRTSGILVRPYIRFNVLARQFAAVTAVSPKKNKTCSLIEIPG
jgi:hypothetical protein